MEFDLQGSWWDHGAAVQVTCYKGDPESALCLVWCYPITVIVIGTERMMFSCLLFDTQLPKKEVLTPGILKEDKCGDGSLQMGER